MAFKSVVARDELSGRVPYVRIAWSGGRPHGYLSRQVAIGTDRIHFELDERRKMLRIRPAPTEKDSIFIGTSSSRNFTVRKAVANAIGTDSKIPLTLAADGWWYGSYNMETPL